MAVIFKDIDLSFKSHPVSKDIISKTDVNAVKQALRNLFMTSPFESAFDPDFGMGLKFLLFEPMSPPLIAVIQRKINEQIIRYEPRCVVENIDVAERGDNGIDVTLKFFVTGLPTLQTFNYVLERVK